MEYEGRKVKGKECVKFDDGGVAGFER